jgi:hypothetical protein
MLDMLACDVTVKLEYGSEMDNSRPGVLDAIALDSTCNPLDLIERIKSYAPL